MKTQKIVIVKKLCSALLIFTLILSGKAFSQTWSTLGTGTNDWVYASAVYNGDLIVGGNFTSAGGVSANHIARWDGTNWYPLGLGVNAKVWALMAFNGSLYVGGEFTEAGGKPMLYIARWNGTKWLNNLGDMGDIVTSFAVYNNSLIAGGYFIEADGIPVNNIAQYTNGHWAPMGSGVIGTQGSVMALEVYNNELIAGGFFTAAGGTTASHIAKWNGTTWSALGTGISNIVYSLTNYNSNLIAGGLFTSAGGVPANNIASWDGSSWSPLGSGMSGVFYQYVFALKTYKGNLIAGGYFTHSDGLLTNGIAKWDGVAWSDMGGGLFEPGNVCGTHTLCLYGDDLVDGGLFNTAGGAFNARNIASWNEPLLNPGASFVYMPLAPVVGDTVSFQNLSINSTGYVWNFGDGDTSTATDPQHVYTAPGTYPVKLIAYNDSLSDSITTDVIVSGVLAVRLVSFTGSHYNDYNLLQWSIAEDASISKYNLQRSIDGNSFTTINTMGTTTISAVVKYSYKDAGYKESKNYYRLQMVDGNGNVTYSNIITLSSAMALAPTLQISPNPAISGHTISVNVYSPIAGNAVIQILNGEGKLMNSTSVNLVAGNNVFMIATGNYAHGSYYITIKGCVELNTKLLVQ